MKKRSRTTEAKEVKRSRAALEKQLRNLENKEKAEDSDQDGEDGRFQYLFFLIISLSQNTNALYEGCVYTHKQNIRIRNMLGEEGCEIENDYYWLLLTKPF